MELVRGSDVMVTWQDEGGNSEEVEGSLVWQDGLLVLQRARHNPDRC